MYIHYEGKAKKFDNYVPACGSFEIRKLPDILYLPNENDTTLFLHCRYWELTSTLQILNK